MDSSSGGAVPVVTGQLASPQPHDLAGQQRTLPVVVSAALLLAGCFLRWPALGRTRWTGFEFAGNVAALGRTLDAPVLRWVGAAFFLVPLSAGLSLMVIAAPRRVAVVIWRILGSLSLLVAGLTAAAAVKGGLRVSTVVGPVVAAVGGLALTVTCGRVHRRPPASDSIGLPQSDA